MLNRLRLEKTHYSLVTDGVARHEQTLAPHKPFWVFFVTNVSISTWLIGVLIAQMGVDLGDALLALLLGSALGAAIPAILAVMGPLTGLPQLEAGRFSFGLGGKKIPALINWIGTVGMDVIQNVVSAAALVELSGLPFWGALAVLVAIQLIIGVYGHHMVQEISRYSGIALGVLFAVIGCIALAKTNGLPVAHPTASFKDTLSALVLVVAYNISYAPYATDYTRYLPKETAARSVFLPVFLGLFLSLAVFGLFGYATAAMVADATPQGVMTSLKALTGGFAPLVLLLIAFNSTPANAMNDNSAAYCLIAGGLSIPRPIAAIFGALAGFAVGIAASDSFIDFFENFLFLFAHGIAPWSAIILVHWAMAGRLQPSLSTPRGFTRGFWLFAAITGLSVWLFSANSLYTGLLTDAVGGVDVGPYIGFAVAAALYALSLKLAPLKPAAIPTL